MNETRSHVSRRALRTPRAASFAGIIFALLYGVGYFLVQLSFPEDFIEPGVWLEHRIQMVSIGLSFLPFAGIAFLWFIGVVRDRLGYLEDQFFSSLFLGSGLLYLGFTLAAGTIAGGLLNVYARYPGVIKNLDAFFTARAISDQITTVVSIRMSGMFMFVLGTMWARTKVMPRWLAYISFSLALVLVIGIGLNHWLALVFPAWVFLISIFILIINYRQSN